MENAEDFTGAGEGFTEFESSSSSTVTSGSSGSDAAGDGASLLVCGGAPAAVGFAPGFVPISSIFSTSVVAIVATVVSFTVSLANC